MVTSQFFYNSGPVQMPGTISGIDVDKQKSLFGQDSKMDDGDIDELKKGGDLVVMGRGLAEKMSVGVGDSVSVTTPQGYNLVLKVAGIFSYGMATLD